MEERMKEPHLGQGESSPFMTSKLYRDERHDRKSLKCLD